MRDRHTISGNHLDTKRQRYGRQEPRQRRNSELQTQALGQWQSCEVRERQRDSEIQNVREREAERRRHGTGQRDSEIQNVRERERERQID